MNILSTEGQAIGRMLGRLLVVGLVLILAGCATDAGQQGPIIGGAGTPDTGQKVHELAASAETALAHGDFDDARSMFSMALRLRPGDPRAKVGLAEVELESGRIKSALPLFDDVTKDKNDKNYRARALQGKGIVLLLMGKSMDAHKTLEEAVRTDPSLWRAWNALGQYFDHRNEWKDASRCYRKALAIHPGAPIVLNNEGMSSLSQGQYAKAEKRFDEALQKDPDNGIIKSNLRLALAWQGKYVEALSGATDSDLPKVLNDVGYVALLRGDYAVAEGYFSRAMHMSPSFFAKAWRNLKLLKTLKEKSKNKNIKRDM